MKSAAFFSIIMQSNTISIIKNIMKYKKYKKKKINMVTNNISLIRVLGLY